MAAVVATAVATDVATTTSAVMSGATTVTVPKVHRVTAATSARGARSANRVRPRPMVSATTGTTARMPFATNVVTAHPAARHVTKSSAPHVKAGATKAANPKRDTPREGEARDDTRADGRREGGASGGNERRSQTPRPPRVQTPAADASSPGVAPEVNADGTPAGADAGQRREGGRRRRRGRGGQGGADKGPRVENATGELDGNPVESGSDTAAADEAANASSFEGRTESIDQIWPEAAPVKSPERSSPHERATLDSRDEFSETAMPQPASPDFAADVMEQRVQHAPLPKAAPESFAPVAEFRPPSFLLPWLPCNRFPRRNLRRSSHRRRWTCRFRRTRGSSWWKHVMRRRRW